LDPALAPYTIRDTKRRVGAPSLSIVIPAYDEESRIGGTLSRTFAYLDAELPESEVLVVADGSTDRTEDIVRRLADDEPRLRLLVSRVNCGKGAAVRRGVLESVGRRVLFMDADLATPLSEVAHLLAALDEGYDVAIGSRAHRESEIVERQPWARERMGKTFNVFVQALVIRGYWDTQCGFKAFTREAADALFDRLTIERFAFDVELLLLARDLGFRVREVPVAWSHVPESKVSPTRDATRMLVDLLRLRARRMVGRRGRALVGERDPATRRSRD
jgi:dolichyl-phosphate beta-glucosyltransferase